MKEFLRWDGAYYKRQGYVQERFALQYLSTLNFKGDESILDIGCGTGGITVELAKRLVKGKVIGLDLSEPMLKEAKSLSYCHSNLHFSKQSADDFSFDCFFDYIVSFSALQYVKDHRLVLEKCARHLKSNGTIFFLFVSGINPLIRQVLESEPWAGYMANQTKLCFITTKEDYASLLPTCGFQIDALENVFNTYCFTTIQELVSHFMTWLPFYTQLPTPRCLELAQQIAENIAKTSRKKCDITFSTPVLFVKARHS